MTSGATTDTPAEAAGTASLTPGADCARALYIADVNYLNEMEVKAGESIIKT